MPESEVFAQAMEHVPALLLTYLTIFVAYWTLGIINIPRWAGRDSGRTSGFKDERSGTSERNGGKFR